MNVSIFPWLLYERGVSGKSLNSVSIEFGLFIIYKKIKRIVQGFLLGEEMERE